MHAFLAKRGCGAGPPSMLSSTRRRVTERQAVRALGGEDLLGDSATVHRWSPPFKVGRGRTVKHGSARVTFCAVPFDLELTDDQQQLREKCHTFAREVIRPVAAEHDQRQELPWPVLEEAARHGLYEWQLYAELSSDPTGL